MDNEMQMMMGGTVQDQTVDPPQITTASLASGRQGVAYSVQLTATGVVTSWELAGGVLPEGITLSSSGLLSGTPTESGTFDKLSFTAIGPGGEDTVENLAIVLATPLAPPAGATGWLKLDAAAVGAFPDVANAGSVSGTWARNATGVVLASGGPNGMKYASNPGTTDHLKCGTLTIGDFITIGKGMFGLIAALVLDTSLEEYTNDSLVRNSGTACIGLGSKEDTGELSPYYRGNTGNYVLPGLVYESGEWCAVVMRWERGAVNKLYASINGGEWLEVAISQNAFSVAGLMILFDSGNHTTAGIAEWLAYADQSEAMGDDLMAYLMERAGL